MTARIDIPLPDGFRANGVAAGIKPRAPDLGVLIADAPRPIQALFTRNSLQGAHIPVCREHLERSGGLARAVVVNSGNANCATGRAGIEATRRICAATGELVGCNTEQVLHLSTGVIGAQLPTSRVLDALPKLCEGATPSGGGAFAEAIMTTDTRPKFATAKSGDARVTGIAKGAGMVHPDLATMLAFVLSDAHQPEQSEAHASALVDRSFHRLTIDGDTSPNDTVLVWHAEHFAASTLEDECEVARHLCRQIAADGEGATRLVTVLVHGASTETEAVDVGRTIATSMLTKTAVTGRDPNWGRILSAAGRSARFEPKGARVFIGDVDVFAAGEPLPNNEANASQHLRDNESVVIGVELGIGTASAEVWTCDLTRDYVSINADYRS